MFLKTNLILKNFNNLLKHKMNKKDINLIENNWNPINFIKIETLRNLKYAVVVLHRPIFLKQDFLLSVWEKACITLTIDGGTNRWINYLGDHANTLLSGKCKKYLPTLVTGDMDSILPEYLEKLKCLGSKIIYTVDYNETDFTKGIKELGQYANGNQINLDGIVVLAETSGRIDHIIGQISTLHKTHKFVDDTPVFLLSCTSISCLLKPGKHKIHVPDILLKNNSWCSLIPFGSSENCISTTGLKWNLNNTCMQYGSLISTSNTYDGHSEVTVTTDVHLLWSMGIEPITGMSEI